MKLTVVIPTWNLPRAESLTKALAKNRAHADTTFCIVGGDGKKRGALEAMLEGARFAADRGAANVIGFLHDDVEILEEGWDERIMELFRTQPKAGLVGFGGALGLGTDELYKRAYNFRQLARINFYSNMEDAEVHGFRATETMRVSVLDGFAQFFPSAASAVMVWEDASNQGMPPHHMYDAWAACWVAERGCDAWMLPIRCSHHGGLTSTSEEYNQWLRDEGWVNDSFVHARAHEVIYNRFRKVLPLRVDRKFDMR